ncbi:hypothetical protein [Streptomyces sp. NPDC048638]|uniref:hypothetical protein n=1 Tax=Streptomyces sp. NPDC048638 TaxID=3365580 RepID=UPI00371F2713
MGESPSDQTGDEVIVALGVRGDRLGDLPGAGNALVRSGTAETVGGPERRAGLRVHHSQPNLGARALVDSGTFAHGSPEDIAEQLAEYGRAGVDEVVVNVAGVYSEHGHPDAVQDLQDILAACREKEQTHDQVRVYGHAEAPPGRTQGGDAPQCPTTSLAG